jgi:hypothetical protein
MKISIVMTMTVLFIGVCLGGESPEDSMSIKMADPARSIEYKVCGQHVEGFLSTYRPLPEGRTLPPRESWLNEGPAFLLDYLWFPNPFSSPAAFVVVIEATDIHLAVFADDGRQVEGFVFKDVEPGVYMFGFVQGMLPKQLCNVRMLVEGVPAGEARIYSTHGSQWR